MASITGSDGGKVDIFSERVCLKYPETYETPSGTGGVSSKWGAAEDTQSLALAHLVQHQLEAHANGIHFREVLLSGILPSYFLHVLVDFFFFAPLSTVDDMCVFFFSC